MGERHIDLAITFGDVARSLLADDGIDEILQRIVHVAVEIIDGCDHAGIDLVQDRRIKTVVTSDAIAATVARIQEEVGEGPCLSAIREHEMFHLRDLARDGQWPEFARRAEQETDISSVLGFRLYAAEDTIGALDLYSSRPHAFDASAEAIGSVLAAHAAVAITTERRRTYLMDAIENRDVIGQAKGILMERDDLLADQAFEVLRATSQRRNVKLRVVADGIVERART